MTIEALRKEVFALGEDIEKNEAEAKHGKAGRATKSLELFNRLYHEAGAGKQSINMANKAVRSYLQIVDEDVKVFNKVAGYARLDKDSYQALLDSFEITPQPKKLSASDCLEAMEAGCTTEDEVRAFVESQGKVNRLKAQAVDMVENLHLAGLTLEDIQSLVVQGMGRQATSASV